MQMYQTGDAPDVVIWTSYVSLDKLNKGNVCDIHAAELTLYSAVTVGAAWLSR